MTPHEKDIAVQKVLAEAGIGRDQVAQLSKDLLELLKRVDFDASPQYEKTHKCYAAFRFDLEFSRGG